MPRSRSRSPPRRQKRSRSKSYSPRPSSSSRHRRHTSRERERDRDGEDRSSSSSRRRGRKEEGQEKDWDRDRGRREGRRNKASPSPPRRERGRGKETRWGERPADDSCDVPSLNKKEEARREQTGPRGDDGVGERPEGAAGMGGRVEGGRQREERRRERPVPFGEKPKEQEARYEWGKPAPTDDQEGGNEEGGEGGKSKAPQLVAKPNFGLTGALATDSQTGNVYKGVVLKWTEPDDARKPEKGWRMYVFKDGVLKDTLHLHRQSAYLVGRHDVADLKIEHPSCSKQHAVLQFRRREEKEGGGAVVRPYLMDLESVNKTRLNGEEVPPARYVELRPQDMIQFGLSSREYILMHENMVSAGT